VGQQTVEEHDRLAADKQLRRIAEHFTVPGGIAVGDASQVDVSVGVVPDQIEEAAAAFGERGAARSADSTASLRVASQRLEQEVDEVEEGVEEGSPDDRPKVELEETGDGEATVGCLVAPAIPLHCISRDEEVD
jgi:hypothetical protein